MVLDKENVTTKVLSQEHYEEKCDIGPLVFLGI